MLRGCSLVLLLGAMMDMTLPCSGFIAERSVNIPAAWNIVPSLEPEQEVIVDRASSERTQVTGVNKALQISDTKESTKSTEQTNPGDTTREKTSDFILENVESEPHLAKIVRDTAINPMEGNIINDNVASTPRNVVLLLIAKSGQDPENFWKDFKASHSFSVEGSLQSCHSTEIEAARFSLDDALVSGSKGKECDCDRFLRSNVAALLFWARDVKGMATGTLSNTNITIPPLSGYEDSMGITRELDETDENNVRSEIRRDWHVIDSGKLTHRASSLVFTPNSREDGTDEAAWNVFDVFSKIRMALFRSLVESLGGAIGTSEEPIPSRRSHLVSSNLADIVGELKSLQNEKGFILVAMTSMSEVTSAMELLQREVSQDTLLVVAGVCSHDTKPIQFLAQGPAAKMLREASTIWDVPTVIKNAIANGCQGFGCRVRRHEPLPLPVAQLKLIPQNAFALRRMLRDSAEKSDNETKALAASSSKSENVKKPEDSTADKEETAKESEKRSAPELDARNATPDINVAAKFSTIIGIITSIVAFTLTS